MSIQYKINIAIERGTWEPQHRHIGYGTDAIQLILRYAFHELNFNRVGLDVIGADPRL